MKVLNRRWSALCALAFALQILIVDHVSAQGDDPDTKALAGYRLTDEGVENFAQASRNLVAALKADPGLERVMEGSGEGTIAETAAMYDAQPAVRKAIESANMTSLEYVTFLGSMIQAGMAAWLVEEYGQDKLPEGMPRENVDYYLANKDKFAVLTAELEQQSDEAE